MPPWIVGVLMVLGSIAFLFAVYKVNYIIDVVSGHAPYRLSRREKAELREEKARIAEEFEQAMEQLHAERVETRRQRLEEARERRAQQLAVRLEKRRAAQAELAAEAALDARRNEDW